jgi:hypothetical protein
VRSWATATAYAAAPSVNSLADTPRLRAAMKFLVALDHSGRSPAGYAAMNALISPSYFGSGTCREVLVRFVVAAGTFASDAPPSSTGVSEALPTQWFLTVVLKWFWRNCGSPFPVRNFPF